MSLLDGVQGEDVEVLHVVMELVVAPFFLGILQLAFWRDQEVFDLRNEIVRQEKRDIAFGELMRHGQDVVELAVHGAVLTELPLVAF